jgi:hypothetical protein
MKFINHLNVKTMKKLLTIILLCGVCYGYAQDTPPYAASTKTWKFGGQTWSDHINMPECNKTSFDGGDDNAPKADCRNNPGYYYLYSWEYVRLHAAILCPSPWRVPSFGDIPLLLPDSAYKPEVWGYSYSGACTLQGQLQEQGSFAHYWTSDVYGEKTAVSWALSRDDITMRSPNRTSGRAVRCVK